MYNLTLAYNSGNIVSNQQSHICTLDDMSSKLAPPTSYYNLLLLGVYISVYMYATILAHQFRLHGGSAYTPCSRWLFVPLIKEKWGKTRRAFPNLVLIREMHLWPFSRYQPGGGRFLKPKKPPLTGCHMPLQNLQFFKEESVDNPTNKCKYIQIGLCKAYTIYLVNTYITNRSNIYVYVPGVSRITQTLTNSGRLVPTISEKKKFPLLRPPTTEAQKLIWKHKRLSSDEAHLQKNMWLSTPMTFSRTTSCMQLSILHVVV